MACKSPALPFVKHFIFVDGQPTFSSKALANLDREFPFGNLKETLTQFCKENSADNGDVEAFSPINFVPQQVFGCTGQCSEKMTTCVGASAKEV